MRWVRKFIQGVSTRRYLTVLRSLVGVWPLQTETLPRISIRSCTSWRWVLWCGFGYLIPFYEGVFWRWVLWRGFEDTLWHTLVRSLSRCFFFSASMLMILQVAWWSRWKEGFCKKRSIANASFVFFFVFQRNKKEWRALMLVILQVARQSRWKEWSWYENIFLFFKGSPTCI